MYRTYRTTKDTVIAAPTTELEDAEITVELITDLDRKEYALVKRQEKIAIYNLSLVGYVTKIIDDVSFEEYRDITYARLDKELLEMGIKPKRRDFLKFDRRYFDPEDTTSS
jgi:hypothetical protein